MRGMKSEITKDMKLEERLLEAYKKELAALPKGSLSHYRKGTHIYYKHTLYVKGKDGLTRRADRHLGKNDGAVIFALQRKAYLKEAIRRMEKNLKAQKRAAVQYEAYDFYSVWDSLGEAYRADNIEAFMKQEGIEIKHVGPKGQNYRPEGLGQNTTGDFDSRSKGEAIIAELLMARKIVFQFEREFRVKLGSGQVIVLHPDFCIPTRDGRYILWEHLGRLEKKFYAVDAGERLYLYNQAGFNPGSNLILTANDRDGHMDMKAIAQILDWLETVCVFEE